MKGGPRSVLRLGAGDAPSIAQKAAEVLKTQVFLYEADMEWIEVAYKDGNEMAKDIPKATPRPNFYGTPGSR